LPNSREPKEKWRTNWYATSAYAADIFAFLLKPEPRAF
jgi:hypothetical protein